ncbi:MAG: hypothetical protein ACRDJE_06255 [Dehalococcoidia bacterium]
MARHPRRMRPPFITRSEIIATVVLGLIVVWLAMMAVGMSVR